MSLTPEAGSQVQDPSETIISETIISETIVAQATAVGKGGVAIVRVSGPKAKAVAQAILKTVPEPRTAAYLPFYSSSNDVIDIGLALYFPNPNSYTGEDVLELQGHGGQVLVDMLIKSITALGVRLSEPGEFTQRAFLNGKLDLTQAEAIADMINATSEQSAKYAVRSLQGAFSKTIESLFKDLVSLRMYVEAALDFPEEEIDFISDGKIETALAALKEGISAALRNAKQGVLLQEGATVVIAGKPNAGKSSLLNALSGSDTAIVTEIAGTTRDVLKEDIYIDGIPVRFVDTAGLRESVDLIEQEGIKRAKAEIKKADHLFYVTDLSDKEDVGVAVQALQQTGVDLAATVIYNKTDLMQAVDFKEKTGDFDEVFVSAKTQTGIDNLKSYLKEKLGYQTTEEGGFIARRRHLVALKDVDASLKLAQEQLQSGQGELVAEELKMAQESLGKITGKFSSEDLLGEIFSQFCIGK